MGPSCGCLSCAAACCGVTQVRCRWFSCHSCARKLAGYFHWVNMTGSGGAPFFVNVGSQCLVADDTFDAGFFPGLLGG